MAKLKRTVSALLCLALLACAGGCGQKTTEKKSGEKKVRKPSSSQTASANESVTETTSVSEPTTETVWIPEEDPYQSPRYIYTAQDVAAESGEADVPFASQIANLTVTADYAIVYPAADDGAKTYAGLLKTYYKSKFGLNLALKDDGAAAVDKEILVGNTNRTSGKCAEGDFFVKTNGKKLIFCGGHDVMLKKAVEIFIRLGTADGKTHTFTRSTDFVTNRFGYSYVWGDEFEGTKLDPTLWDLQTKMGATAEMLLDKTEKCVRVDNGYLKLTALRNWDAKNAGSEFIVPWSVTSMNEMSYKYGYVEMRARVPFVRGVWPSLWTSSAGALGPKTTFDYTIEVDIFEVFSSVDSLSSNIHKWYGNGDHTQSRDRDRSYTFKTDNEMKDEYHTYGMEWTPEAFIMYIDGEKYKTFDLTVNMDDGASGMGGFDTQLYLILNNHLFTNSSSYKPYSGCEIYQKELPAEYDVDWIRLYQKKDGISRLYTK